MKEEKFNTKFPIAYSRFNQLSRIALKS